VSEFRAGVSCARAHRVRATNKGAKNLDQATELKTVAGKVESNSKGKILEFAWYLKREGNTDPTIRTYTSLLRKVDRLNANILDP
jgi:hypothetical protein